MKQLRQASMLIMFVFICLSVGVSSAQQPSAVNDPLRNQQWYLDSIHADQAWAIQGKSTVRMGIIDTGYASHEDLPTLPASNWKDFTVDNSPTPKDEIGHGMFVAGQACAYTNNGKGIAGIAYDCPNLVVARVYKTGNTDVATLIKAIDWMTAQNVRVLLLTAELVAADPGAAYRGSVERFQAQCIIVAPAGNSGKDEVVWPARFPEVISVASVNRQLKRSSFSNFGSWVTISAPGEEILGPAAGNKYVTAVGTSKADVFVFATIGLMLTHSPCITNNQVVDFLKRSSAPLSEQVLGSGLLDMSGALNLADTVNCVYAPLIRK